MKDDWFGWRVVGKTGTGHAFRGTTQRHWDDLPQAGERSLCGKVGFGPAVRTKRKYRPCATCSAIWSAKYPPKEKH